MLVSRHADEKTARLFRAVGGDPAQRSFPKLVTSGREVRLEAAVLLALEIRVIGAEIENGLFFAGVLAGLRGEFFDLGSPVNDDAGGNVLEVRHIEPQ